ncbi:MAG: type II secretion system F family protein [Actinobacteria bacterium]|nr:MAG: type II secretion system F family protein [Actinomycetota bacterium]
MVLLAIAGILLLGGGIVVLVSNLRKPAGGAGMLDQIGTYGYVAEAARGAGETAGRRPLDSLAGRLGDTAARRLSRYSEDKVRQKLIAAGMYGTSPRKLLGYQVIIAIFLGLLGFWLGATKSLPIAIVFLAVGLALGWWLPSVYVDRTRRLRYEQMDRQMPDLIDLLIVCVEAGLGILASMRVASEKLKDPLGQELRLTLQEQRMGLSVGEAIQSLGKRADCDNMRIFVRALTQGEKLGVSIGKTMRDLAEEMRKRRKAAAEERAQKMPLKMLFPLLFFIFPAIFIVLLVPAFINIGNLLK